MQFSQLVLLAFSAIAVAEEKKATVYSEKNHKGFSAVIGSNGECQPLRLRELQRHILSIDIPSDEGEITLETVFCEGYTDLNCNNKIWEFASSQDSIQNSAAIAVQCQTLS